MPRSMLTAIAAAALGLGFSSTPALAEPVVQAPLVKTLEPALCWYGSNIYSDFYALNITAPRHLPVTTAVKGGYVFRCRAAMRVAALFTARYPTVAKGAAESGSLTLTVGPHYKNLRAWRLGRVTCTYRLVHGAVVDHRAMRCRHGHTLVTFSSPA